MENLHNKNILSNLNANKACETDQISFKKLKEGNITRILDGVKSSSSFLAAHHG